jgi:hypothetical protein
MLGFFAFLTACIVVLAPCGNGQGYASTTSEIESWTFTAPDPDVPSVCGVVYSQSLFPYTMILELGRPIVMTIGVNVSMLVNATTLTYAWALRDMTTMPEVTLAQAIQTVTNGTYIATVALAVNNTILTGTSNFTYSSGTYVIGSNDSYGNPILSGHMIAFDRVIFFNSPLENQNATINVFVSTPVLTYW